jgi:hypothetical protein
MVKSTGIATSEQLAEAIVVVALGVRTGRR